MYFCIYPDFFIVTQTVSHLPVVDVLSYIFLLCTREMTFSGEKTASCGIITDDDASRQGELALLMGADDGKQQEREFRGFAQKARVSRANCEKIYCTNEHFHCRAIYFILKRHPKSATNSIRPSLLSSQTINKKFKCEAATRRGHALKPFTEAVAERHLNEVRWISFRYNVSLH